MEIGELAQYQLASIKMTERKNMIASCALVGFSVALMVYLIPTQIVESSGGLSPRLFPYAACIATCLGGLTLFVRSIRRPSSTNSEVKSTFSLLPLSVLVSLATFIFLFEKVGYFVSAPVLIAALMLIYGNRNPLIVLMTTAVSSISLYVMFVYGLNLYLGG